MDTATHIVTLTNNFMKDFHVAVNQRFTVVAVPLSNIAAIMRHWTSPENIRMTIPAHQAPRGGSFSEWSFYLFKQFQVIHEAYIQQLYKFDANLNVTI